MGYKFLEHTADIKIQAEGKTLEKAFESSALALLEVMLDFEKIKIKPEKSRIISAEGKDLSELLYSFLEEFIYMLDADDFVLAEIEDIDITEDKKRNKSFVLSAHVLGDDASKYKFTNNVKAITYSEMRINKSDGKKVKYVIEFVIDV